MAMGSHTRPVEPPAPDHCFAEEMMGLLVRQHSCLPCTKHVAADAALVNHLLPQTSNGMGTGGGHLSRRYGTVLLSNMALGLATRTGEGQVLEVCHCCCTHLPLQPLQDVQRAQPAPNQCSNASLMECSELFHRYPVCSTGVISVLPVLQAKSWICLAV